MRSGHFWRETLRMIRRCSATTMDTDTRKDTARAIAARISMAARGIEAAGIHIRNRMEISCAVCLGYFQQFLKNRLCFLKVRPIFFAAWNTMYYHLDFPSESPLSLICNSGINVRKVKIQPCIFLPFSYFLYFLGNPQHV